MKIRCIAFCILLLVNIFVFSLVCLVNSELAQWGISIFVPGLFFFSSSILLDNWEGALVCTITGLFLDSVYQTPFGLLGITLPLLCLLGKGWLKNSSNNRPWRAVLFQVIANLFTGIFLFAVFFLKIPPYTNLDFTRLIIDLILSSIVIIPLCFWLHDFTVKIAEKLSVNSKIKVNSL